MEINTANVRITISDQDIASDGYDFLSIVTHETGHFLGMAHSEHEDAAMYARYSQGSTAMRQLKADDIAGICSIYFPDGTHSRSDGPVAESACNPSPRPA